MPILNVILEPLQRLIDFFDRRRGLAVVIAALAILIAGTTTAIIRRPPVLAPVIDFVNGSVLSVVSQPLRLSRIFSRGPSSRIMALELELAALRERERENARFRAMLGYRRPQGYQAIPARIIGLDLDPLRGVAWINIGSTAGLQSGEAVVTVDGLVGVVDIVWRGRSRVRLLRNENTPVSVRDTRSRVLGVAEWDPSFSRLRVGKVPYQADVVVGDTLISSGLGGVFPPGLPVGVVASVHEPPERLIKEVELRPFGVFIRLEEVFALLPLAGPILTADPDSTRMLGAPGDRR